MSLVPKILKNQVVQFSEVHFPLIFKCKGRSLDDCLVWIHIQDGKTNPEIAYLEGFFHVDNKMPNVFKNIKNYPEKLLFNLYNMARCKRQFAKTDNKDYYNGYLYFMDKAKVEWDLFNSTLNK